MLLSRTAFGLVRLGSFFHFSTIFLGNVEIDGQFRIAYLDLANKGINQAAAVCLGFLAGGNEKLFQQVQNFFLGEDRELRLRFQRRQLIGQRVCLLFQFGKAVGQHSPGGAVLQSGQQILCLALHVGKLVLQRVLFRVGLVQFGSLGFDHTVCNAIHHVRLQHVVTDGADHQTFQLVLRNVPAVAVLARTAVVEVHLAVAAVTGHALHGGAALAAKQLAGQDVVRAVIARGTALAVTNKHLLRPLP